MLNINWDLKDQPLKFLTAVNESIKNDSPSSDEISEQFFENPDKFEYLDSLVNSDELNEEMLDIIFNILFYDSTNIEKTLKEIDVESQYCRLETFYEILFNDCFYKLITYPFDNQKTKLIFEKYFYHEERQQIQFIDPRVVNPFNWIEYKDPQVFIAKVTGHIIDWCNVCGILFLIRFFKEKNKDVYSALINAFNRLDLSKIYVDGEFFVAPFEDTIKEINTTKTLSVEEKVFVDKLKLTLELYR